MIRVSSNITLFLKIFLPTAWIVFFGLISLAILFANGEDNPMFGNWIFKLVTLSFFLLFLTFLYFTIMRLLRVEFGKEAFIVSNYFKTYQYRYSDIEQIKEYDLIVKKLIRIKMKGDTKLGRSFYFLKSPDLYEGFIRSNKEIFKELIQIDS